LGASLSLLIHDRCDHSVIKWCLCVLLSTVPHLDLFLRWWSDQGMEVTTHQGFKDAWSYTCISNYGGVWTEVQNPYRRQHTLTLQNLKLI
jgi:hypothetical protein